jgi:hypothetical protein
MILYKAGMKMLRQELDFGYFKWIHRPAEKLGVLDNASDYETCRSRVHCNCTHGCIAPRIVYNEADKRYVTDMAGVNEAYAAMNDMKTGRRHTIMGGGDHNNVYFPDFIKYKTTLPDCLMRDENGNYLELHDILIMNGEGIPMPAIDDPTLIALNCESLAVQAGMLKDSQYVAAYVLGSEELYPEYFGLGNGDFRPASWKHFLAWCKSNHIVNVPSPREILEEKGSSAWTTWHIYREQAMADRCASYYRAVLNADDNHLAYYPTHGSTLSDDRRWQLGQQPATLACACDGMEMGHIMIEDDAERRNVIMTGHYTAFGAPVIIPRLGNKQPDLSAIGGGRSFTPQTLRRLVYECVGLGIGTIFPIHWSSRLHDGEWFIKDTPAETECRRVFDELTAAAPYLTGMGRLQPQVGLLAGDATWMRQWDPRWTALMQDALSDHAAMTVISDCLICETLAKKMPVLVIPSNTRVMPAAFDALLAYANAGGKVIVWGEFATQPPVSQAVRERFLAHKNVMTETSQPLPETRILRELFLSGPELGVDGPVFEFTPINYHKIAEAIERFSADCVLRPAHLVSAASLKHVNIYTLTDRKALLFVLVNNSSMPVEFSLFPDSRLIENCLMTDALSGEPVTAAISLEGNTTRMVFCCEPAEMHEFAGLIRSAEKAYTGWKAAGADVSALRLNYAGMRSGPLYQRRATLAYALLDSLAIRASVQNTAEGLAVKCDVLDSDIRYVSAADVHMRITPGAFKAYPLLQDGNGYACLIPQEQLPMCYDMQTQAYSPLTGWARLIIGAEKGDKTGGCIVSAELAVGAR